MKRLALLFATAALALLAGCFLRGIQGDGHLTTNKRPVSDFTTVDAAGGFDITWSSGQVGLAIATAPSANDWWPFQSPVSASDPLGSYPFIANQLQPDTAPLRTLEELKRPKGFWDPMELPRVQPLNMEARMVWPMAVDAERLYKAIRPASHFDQALISR